LNFHAILADVQQNYLLYLSMPLIAAAIGYVTKLAAIKMMFDPLEFKGYKPWKLGWQGVIPSRAEPMARISCQTMTQRLVKPQDIFSKLDPVRIAEEIEKPLMDMVELITHQVMTQYQPGLWEKMPLVLRKRLIRRIQKKSPDVIKNIFEQFKNNIDQFFDLEDMVVTNLVKDKALLNQIFLEVGRQEFRFIRNSGIYFGALIGVVQMFVWMFTQSPIIMPIFGGFTGWFTDWLALRMIFRPHYPTKYFFGLFQWQGLFLKRKAEVCELYGKLMTEKILTPRAMMDAVLTGPLSDRLFTLIHHEVKISIDQQAGLLKPLVVFAVGSHSYMEMKKSVSENVMQRLPETMRYIEKYAEEAMDIKNMLVDKMQQMTVEEFEQLLRPAFQQDEWKLIAVGAVLGFLVGELQVLMMLHGMKLN